MRVERYSLRENITNAITRQSCPRTFILLIFTSGDEPISAVVLPLLREAGQEFRRTAGPRVHTVARALFRVPTMQSEICVFARIVAARERGALQHISVQHLLQDVQAEVPPADPSRPAHGRQAFRVLNLRKGVREKGHARRPHEDAQRRQSIRVLAVRREIQAALPAPAARADPQKVIVHLREVRSRILAGLRAATTPGNRPRHSFQVN